MGNAEDGRILEVDRMIGSFDFEEHLLPTTLVVAFAGGPQNRYQFGNALRKLQVPHILLRDTSQRHYEEGILGVQSIYSYIMKKRVGFERVVTVGVSSGAYAALRHGLLAYVNEIIAISPITGRSEKTAADFPPEYRDQIIDPKQPGLDLKYLYRNWKNIRPRVRAFISDGRGCELDRGMCERIGITDITVVPGYSHGDLARGMRDKGMFKELFS